MGVAVSTVQIDRQVTAFLASPRKMLIGGKWVGAASGKTFATLDPSTGEVLAQVAEGDKEDIDRAVQAARAAFETGPWRKMTPILPIIIPRLMSPPPACWGMTQTPMVTS